MELQETAPKQKQPPTVSGTTFEGLFVRALTPEGAFLQDLKAIGFDPSAMQPNYPERLFNDCLAVARRHVYPDLEATEADRKLGERTVAGFLDTLVGKVIAVSLPLLGVERIIKRLPRYITAGREHGEVKVADVGEKSRKVSFFGNGISPHFTAGAIEASLRRTNQPVTVRVTAQHVGSYELAVSW